MKIKVEVARKMGTNNYGSNGASCTIEFDSMADEDSPQELQAEVEQMMGLARTFVDAELAGQGSQPGRAPQGGAPSNGHSQPQGRSSGGSSGGGYSGRSGGGGGGSQGGFTGIPRTGGQLFKWAQSKGLADEVSDWGKNQGLPRSWKEWADERVSECYEYMTN